MTGESVLVTALKRDRAVVLVAALLITALAWAWLFWFNKRMPMPVADMAGMDMAGMDMTAMAPQLTAWSVRHLLIIFVMWAVMMVGMMTPSVAPMLLIYLGFARHSAKQGHVFAPVGWFAAGYLAAWSLFAALATLAQWGLESLAYVTPMMQSASRLFGGVLLLAAGIYQWLPAKDACLSQCRAPLAFVQRHGGFRPAGGAALRLGALHGLYCIGCCWALMALLFVGGVMNLLWIAALMLVVLVEKLLPRGRAFTRVLGAAAAAAGVWLLAT